jgi:hypothetical protein
VFCAVMLYYMNILIHVLSYKDIQGHTSEQRILGAKKPPHFKITKT